MTDTEINHRLDKIMERLDNIESVISPIANSNKDLLDTRQIRFLTKLSDKTLYRKRKSGEFPSYKIGGKIYYLRSEIMEIICNQENKQ